MIAAFDADVVHPPLLVASLSMQPVLLSLGPVAPRQKHLMQQKHLAQRMCLTRWMHLTPRMQWPQVS